MLIFSGFEVVAHNALQLVLKTPDYFIKYSHIIKTCEVWLFT